MCNLCLAGFPCEVGMANKQRPIRFIESRRYAVAISPGL